jgi:hypothetical protein
MRFVLELGSAGAASRLAESPGRLSSANRPTAFFCKPRRTCINHVGALQRCRSALPRDSVPSMPKLFLRVQGYGRLVSSPALIYRSLKPRMHVDSRWIWTRANDTVSLPNTRHRPRPLSSCSPLHRCTCQGVLSMNPSPCSMSATPPGRICALTDRPTPAVMHSLWCSHGSHLQ